jgi:membrane protease YdiL (CAAX protease family)
MFTERDYAAQRPLIERAREKAQLWRLCLGLLVVAMTSYLLTATALPILGGLFPGQWLWDLPTGATPTAMFVLLGSFLFITLGVALALRLLHQRPLVEVLGPLPLASWQFLRVSGALLLLGLALLAVFVLFPVDLSGGRAEPLVQNMSIRLWLVLLLPALAAVLIQISAEEILFRGYVQQTLAARFRSPLVWLILPSALFAIGHYVPADAGDNAALIALWAGLFGVLMADLTARAGSLGPACAVHFFNNILAMLIFGSPTNLSGLALYLLPYELSDTVAVRQMLWLDGAIILLGWLAARLAIRR